MTQIAMCPQESVALNSPPVGYPEIPAQPSRCAGLLKEQPSFESGASVGFNRLQLCVAAPSNVGCRYCDSNYAPEVETTKEALKLVKLAIKSNPNLRSVEVSGLGDALASPVTYKVLKRIKRQFPHLTLHVATNGLLLPQKLDALEEAGVSVVKVTVNAVDAKVGSKIYSFIRLGNRTLRGEEAFEVLSLNQLEGIRNAADAGLMVEVESAYIPSVNSEHLVEVAKIVRSIGAYIMNVVPITEDGAYAGLEAPSPQELRRVCRACEDVCVSEVRFYTSPTVGCSFVGL
jgi:nitrogen fixation protein NifB